MVYTPPLDERDTVSEVHPAPRATHTTNTPMVLTLENRISYWGTLGVGSAGNIHTPTLGKTVQDDDEFLIFHKSICPVFSLTKPTSSRVDVCVKRFAGFVERKFTYLIAQGILRISDISSLF